VFLEHVAEIEEVLKAEIPEALVLGTEVIDETPGPGLAAGEENLPVERIVGLHETVHVPFGNCVFLGVEESVHGG